MKAWVKWAIGIGSAGLIGGGAYVFLKFRRIAEGLFVKPAFSRIHSFSFRGVIPVLQVYFKVAIDNLTGLSFTIHDFYLVLQKYNPTTQEWEDIANSPTRVAKMSFKDNTTESHDAPFAIEGFATLASLINPANRLRAVARWSFFGIPMDYPYEFQGVDLKAIIDQVKQGASKFGINLSGLGEIPGQLRVIPGPASEQIGQLSVLNSLLL